MGTLNLYEIDTENSANAEDGFHVPTPEYAVAENMEQVIEEYNSRQIRKISLVEHGVNVLGWAEEELTSSQNESDSVAMNETAGD